MHCAVRVCLDSWLRITPTAEGLNYIWQMSALGQKQTFAPQKGHVRFTPESGHVQCTSACPLCANSGHHSANGSMPSDGVRL